MTRKEYGHTKKWVLYGLISLSSLWTGYALFWFYGKLYRAAGVEIAQAVLALGFVFVFFLIVIGFRLGHQIDRIIQQERLPLHTIASAQWLPFLIRLWRYERKYPDKDEATPANEAEKHSATETEDALPSPPRKRRRGRTPLFTVDRWVPIALKWENRDPLWDNFSLSDLICEYLGVNADGSPVMSEQSYYKKWRDLALKEAARMEKENRSS